jgi:hypothetical protein
MIICISVLTITENCIKSSYHSNVGSNLSCKIFESEWLNRYSDVENIYYSNKLGIFLMFSTLVFSKLVALN